jgi:hypothetical protein
MHWHGTRGGLRRIVQDTAKVLCRIGSASASTFSGSRGFANDFNEIDVMGLSFSVLAHKAPNLVHGINCSIQEERIAMSPRKRRNDSSDDVQPAKKGKTSWERPPKIEDEPGEPYWEVSHYARISLNFSTDYSLPSYQTRNASQFRSTRALHFSPCANTTKRMARRYQGRASV